MEWRPFRTSAIVFGLMMLIGLGVILIFADRIQPNGITDTLIALIVGVVLGAFATAITKLSDDSSPPPPVVPAHIVEKILEAQKDTKS